MRGSALLRWVLALLLACVGPLAGAQPVAPGFAGNVLRYPNTDFPGSDIRAGSADGFDACAARCVAEPRCVAFTLSPVRSCYLKTGVARVRSFPAAESGFLSGRGTPPLPIGGQPPAAVLPAAPAAGPVVFNDNTDLPFNDLKQLYAPVASVDECASRCLGLPHCVAFSFNKSSRLCKGKSAVGAASPNPFVVSGVVGARGSAPNGIAVPTPPAGGAVATPNACSVGGAGRCPGCSVSCPAEQRPVCTAPAEGVGAFCQRDAWCRCAPH
jgi:hypothetical protein